MFYFTYDLFDQRVNEPFYVGITNNPNARLFQHITTRDYNEAKNARVDEILDIKESKEEIYASELTWIRAYEKRGIQLTNIQKARPLYIRTTPRNQTTQ